MKLYIENKKFLFATAVLLISTLIFSKEFLLLDEHTLLIVAFLIFLIAIYDTLANAISSSLRERSEFIQLQFKTLLPEKISMLEKADFLIEKFNDSDESHLVPFRRKVWKVQKFESTMSDYLNTSLNDRLMRVYLELLLRRQDIFRKDLFKENVKDLLSQSLNELKGSDQILFTDSTVETFLTSY